MTAAWAGMLSTIAVTQGAIIAMSIYLHRALAHRSISLHPLGFWRVQLFNVAYSPIASTRLASHRRNPA